MPPHKHQIKLKDKNTAAILRKKYAFLSADAFLSIFFRKDFNEVYTRGYEHGKQEQTTK